MKDFKKNICIINAGLDEKSINDFVKKNFKKNDSITYLIGNNINNSILSKKSICFIFDTRFIRKINISFLKHQKINLVLSDNCYSFLQKNYKLNASNFYNLTVLKNLGPNGFSLSLVRGLYHGCSIVYPMIQYSRIMKYDETYVLGMYYNYGRSMKRNHNKTFTNNDIPDVVIGRFLSNLHQYVPIYFSDQKIFFSNQSIFRM